jgi:hypothetical protein
MILYYAKVSSGDVRTKRKKGFADMHLRAGCCRLMPEDFAYIGPGSNRHMQCGGTD